LREEAEQIEVNANVNPQPENAELPLVTPPINN